VERCFAVGALATIIIAASTSVTLRPPTSLPTASPCNLHEKRSLSDLNRSLLRYACET
jgi:hypothetical protein